MAKTFKNINEYIAYVNKCLRLCMEDVGIEIKDELQDYVMKNWYNKYSPTSYNRTYEFVESATFQVMQTSNGSVYCEVFFDPEKMKAAYDESSFFNKHMSLSGDDVAEYLPGWIENRNNDSPVYSYEGIEMVKNTKEWCKSNYIRLLKESMLKRYGIKLQ